jgi:riboflavin kinase
MQRPIKLSSLILSRRIDSSPQTASRRIKELESRGLISRTIDPDGQWVTITDDGIEMLRKEYYEYVSIFESEGKYLEFFGRLFTGLGEGRYYITKEGYKKQFEGKLGIAPFPGTLNIKLNDQSVLLRRRLEGREGMKITGFKAENRSFGDGKCFKAKIGDLDCAVIIPERTHYPQDVLEIIASMNLRDALRVRDGDELCVRVMLS